MARTCIFCGGGGPFTKEHVLPEWTAKLLGVGRLELSERFLKAPRRSRATVRSFGSTVKVCRACNEGWMSRLEDLTKPILGPMIQPTTGVQLTSDQQTVLAAWLWKIAVLHEVATRHNYFTQAERELLVHEDDLPTDGVRIWIGAYDGDKVANIRGGPSAFGTSDGRGVAGFLLSMYLGTFAAQILCVRSLPNARGIPQSQYDFAGWQSQIWPEPERPIKWPPLNGGLDSKRYDLWHRRWNTPLLQR